MNESVIDNTWRDGRNYGAVMGSIGFTVILINGISIFLVSTNRDLMKKIKVCYIGLLLTDFLLGVAVIIMAISILFKVFQDTVGCFFSYYLYFNFASLTNYMMLLNSLDRFMVLRFTYAYTAWMTPRKMMATVTLIYFCGSTSALVVLFANHQVREYCNWLVIMGKAGLMFNGSVISVCMMSTVGTNIYTATQIWRHTVSIQASTVDGVASRPRLDMISEKKNFITITIVIIVYVICYLPAIIAIFDIWLNQWEDMMTEAKTNPTIGSILAAALSAANSIVNPIIYIWRLKSTRTQCRQCFARPVNVVT